MTGGIIQLVAYGVQDLFLTRDPQITFFKVVYRRHTNFSIEEIPQKFVSTPDFGKTATCVLSKTGDLINKMYLVIVLPEVKKFFDENEELDNITKFAWVRKIGFAIIDYIEIEIGGQVIDRHYGEWLNLWHEIFMSPNLEKSLDYMIGNVPELIDYTNGKESYTLYVPLQFWFCRNSGLALPIISLQYSEVKVRVVMKDKESCYVLNPTNYIDVYDDIVNFKPLEYIEQVVNGEIASGIFTHFDSLKKRLYYKKISKNDFKSIQTQIVPSSLKERADLITDDRNYKYFIRGVNTYSMAMPQVNTSSVNVKQPSLDYLRIRDSYLLVDYIYLDVEERSRFLKAKHDYLIEQIGYVDDVAIKGVNNSVKLSMLLQPSKLLVWVLQQDYLLEKYNNDFFNYTDSYIYKDNKPIGKNMIINETIQLNSIDRVSRRKSQYFSYVQAYQYLLHNPSEGINLYSFCNFPDKFQPSGSCNMSQIDNIDLLMTVSNIININNIAKFRAYSINYNVLRIVNGLSGIVFTK